MSKMNDYLLDKLLEYFKKEGIDKTFLDDKISQRVIKDFILNPNNLTSLEQLNSEHSAYSDICTFLVLLIRFKHKNLDIWEWKGLEYPFLQIEQKYNNDPTTFFFILAEKKLNEERNKREIMEKKDNETP